MARFGVPVGVRVRRLAFLSILRGGFLLSRVGGHNLGSLIDTCSEADGSENLVQVQKKAVCRPSLIIWRPSLLQNNW